MRLWHAVGVSVPVLVILLAAGPVGAQSDEATTASLTPKELIANFKAAPLQKQIDLLIAVEKDKRTDVFGLLLAATEVQEGRVLWAVDRMLPQAIPTDAERAEADRLIERMHGRLALSQRMMAAKFAAALGEPRGFDWALECLQDFYDGGQPVMMECTNLPIGLPRDVPFMFLNFDRPALANYVRLIKKGDRPGALFGVAQVLAPRNDHGYIARPLADSKTLDAAAFHKALAEIKTPLARQIEAIISKEVKRAEPDPLAGLGEADRKEALKAEVTARDFAIEVSRESFSETDKIEFRLRKMTPGTFGWKEVRISEHWTAELPDGSVAGGGGVMLGGGPTSGRASQGEIVAVNSFNTDAIKIPNTVYTQVFTITPMNGQALEVTAKFPMDQLRPKPSGDVDEFLRRLESKDPKESSKAEERFTWSSWDMPKVLAEDGKARLRLVQALMKKAQAAAAEEFKPQEGEREPPLDISEAPGYGGTLLRCLNSMDYLGVKDLPAEDFKALMQAPNFWAARWGYEKLRHQLCDEKNSWTGVDDRVNEMLRDQTKSKDLYAARNAAALLRHANYFNTTVPWGKEGDFKALIGPILKNESPMVRVAGALLAATNTKYKTREGEVAELLEPLLRDPDRRVVRAAVKGLAEAKDLAAGERQARIKIFTRLVSGEPWLKQAVAEAIRENLGQDKDVALVPVLYEALRDTEQKREWLDTPLDDASTADLLGRLAKNPRDIKALWMLYTSGRRWPADTRIGRLQKLLADADAGKWGLGWCSAYAAEKLQAADPDDAKAAAAIAEDLRNHLKAGDSEHADIDCLALAALGAKKPLSAEEFGPGGYLSLPAAMMLFAADPASARESIGAMLHVAEDRSDNERMLKKLDRMLSVPNGRLAPAEPAGVELPALPTPAMPDVLDGSAPVAPAAPAAVEAPPVP
jgi:hypothetical protein